MRLHKRVLSDPLHLLLVTLQVVVLVDELDSTLRRCRRYIARLLAQILIVSRSHQVFMLLLLSIATYFLWNVRIYFFVHLLPHILLLYWRGIINH